MQPYLPPFHHLWKLAQASGPPTGQKVTMTYEGFLALLRKILQAIPVDEVWYLQRYEDVARAVARDPSHSAQRHFVNDGYLEGRLPFLIRVDENWYLENNPDVRDNVRRGLFESGQHHFEQNGYREGRLPFKA